MLRYLRQSVAYLIVMTVVTGILYPLVITAASQAVFPYRANGSLIIRDRVVVGSELIGQLFTGNRYFHGRPSAAGAGYDASASAGSNYGPLNPELLKRVQKDAGAIREREGVPSETPLPTDSVLGSASGLDPHISLQYALMQGPRVAAQRGLHPDQVTAVIYQQAEKQLYGIPQAPLVNVLKLNLALDAMEG